MVYSVDDMPGKEARAAEKRLASLLASKWDRTYRQNSNAPIHCAIDIHASAWLLVLDLEAQGGPAPDDGVAARASVTSQRW